MIHLTRVLTDAFSLPDRGCSGGEDLTRASLYLWSRLSCDSPLFICPREVLSVFPKSLPESCRSLKAQLPALPCVPKAWIDFLLCTFESEGNREGETRMTEILPLPGSFGTL